MRETARGLRVYTVGELEIIGQELALHEQEFAYYCAQHEDVRHRMFQRIQGYRAHNI